MTTDEALDSDSDNGCPCADGYPCGCLSPSLCICDDPDPEVQDLLGRIQALEAGSNAFLGYRPYGGSE